MELTSQNHAEMCQYYECMMCGKNYCHTLWLTSHMTCHWQWDSSTFRALPC